VKKLLSGLILASVGSGLWWMTAQTPRFALHRMNAKLETALRASLSRVGLKNKDILF